MRWFGGTERGEIKPCLDQSTPRAVANTTHLADFVRHDYLLLYSLKTFVVCGGEHAIDHDDDDEAYCLQCWMVEV